MGLILFDYTYCSRVKKRIIASLTNICLFDGYLTETTSYPHSGRLIHLTDKRQNLSIISITRLISAFCSFDGYLTATPSNTQLFGEEMEMIINERSINSTKWVVSATLNHRQNSQCHSTERCLSGVEGTIINELNEALAA
jgi:hypothetical protein